MRRMMLYDRLGNPLGELSENDVFEAVLREEINGEHSLTITTTQVLEKGIRLLYEDGRGKWREFAVAGVDAEHASGNRSIGTYYCVWSMQEDLQGVTVSVMPGVQNPTPAGAALTSLLSSQSRWGRGTITNTATGGASMYDRSAWEALSTLVEVWGGEVDATITIGTQTGVTGRLVDLYAKQGNQTAKRRFDFAHDLQSVKRTLPDTPLYCRISPRGAGEETDAGGHGRKITIESVNDGKDYLEYSPMVDAAKLPDGSGYIYPTLIVENSDCKTSSDLMAWAQSALAEYCVPKVTYEIDVLQAGIEGVDFTGVSLGDAVQVVDRKFSDEGIRIEGRVRSITTDLLNERDMSIVIGDAVHSIASQFAKVDKSLSVIGNDLTTMSTAEYITNLLDRINTEINATGGYTYITEGQGIRTYDTAVSDPLVGSEASAVVEIKGGTIRIANSKTAQGEWNWRSVFTSGHIAADLVTAANITTGYIGRADGGNYWNLDTSQFQMALAGYITRETIYALMGNSSSVDPSGTAHDYRGLLIKSEDTTAAPSSHYSGEISLGLSKNETGSYPSELPYTTFRAGEVSSSYELRLRGGTYRPTTSYYPSELSLTPSLIRATSRSGNNYHSLQIGSTYARIYGYKGSGNQQSILNAYYTGTYPTVEVNTLKVSSSLTVSGSKSRLVETDYYNNRLLYCYETPSPMFGDIGSGVIGEDGLCFVEVDDIFSETVRADLSYQVFLQKCGEGDLWVDTKSPNYFIVQGTPGLRFDWEMKAKQRDFEALRMEQPELDPLNMGGEGGEMESLYAEEMEWIAELERVLYDED